MGVRTLLVDPLFLDCARTCLKPPHMNSIVFATVKDGYQSAAETKLKLRPKQTHLAFSVMPIDGYETFIRVEILREKKDYTP